MKKIIALILVCICAFQMCAFAAEFKDMPNNWSTSALEAAVKNGLLNGDNGYIRASSNMTRAEMATIMVRACGATRTTDISNFSDVKSGDWFFDSMSKAVAMGAFNGSDGKLNPNNPITRQEAFVVLSRVFGVAAGSTVKRSDLDSFKDKDKISEWAKNDVAAVVGQGYVGGNDGYLNPLSNISRAEFAVVMDRMIKYYIDEPMENIPTDGNIMIRSKGVDISGYTTDKNVIFGDVIGEEDFTINDADIKGKLVIRGGKDIVLSGSYSAITILGNGTCVRPGASKVGRVYIGKTCDYDTTQFLGE